MKLTESEIKLIHKWMVQRLDEISDADADVLADLVLVLVGMNKSEKIIRDDLLQHLPEFLTKDPHVFVDELFAQCTKVTAQSDLSRVMCKQDMLGVSPRIPDVGAAFKSVRKRPCPGAADEPHLAHNEQQRKQCKYNGHYQPLGAKRQRIMGSVSHGTKSISDSQASIRLPGASVQNLHEPAAFFIAMQASFSQLIAMLKQSVGTMTYPLISQPDRRTRISVTNAPPHTTHCVHNDSVTARFMEKGTATPSHMLRSGESTLTSIVVDQIPLANLSEQKIFNYFRQFGTVQQVEVHPLAYRATVRFARVSDATAAFGSPKPVFDNPFVVISRSEMNHAERDGGQDIIASKAENGSRHSVDAADRSPYMAAIANRQKVYEHRQRQLKRLKEERDEAVRKATQVAQELGCIKADLASKIATKNGRDASAIYEELWSRGEDPAPSKTQALKDHLAKLEAEAKSLGIDLDTVSERTTPLRAIPYSRNERDRTIKAHVTKRGRNEVYEPGSDDGFNGTSDWSFCSYATPSFVKGKPCSVLRLDNRPREIAIWGCGWTFDPVKKEILLAYLLGRDESVSLEKDPEDTDHLIARFGARWQAEKVMHGSWTILGLGLVKMEWIAGPLSSSTAAPSTRAKLAVGDSIEENIVRDVMIKSAVEKTLQDSSQDLDVAGDDDWDQIL